MAITIHWFRRDLRLDDNTALLAALEGADQLVPLFILDDNLLHSRRVKGSPRIGFMMDCLHALDQSLHQHGSRLVIRRGQPYQVLRDLAQQTGAERVTFNRDYTPYASQRDQQVREALHEIGVRVDAYADLMMHEPDAILKASAEPYQVFAPYKRQWLALPKPLAESFPEQMPPVPDQLESGIIPAASALNGCHAKQPITGAGEAAAQARLDMFVENWLDQYAQSRNQLDEDGTAILSPHLRWGTISIRRCYEAAADHPSTGAQVWMSELAWRDFFMMVLAHHPANLRQNFRDKYDALDWQNNTADFAAWCEGRTGFPVVDAAMRQMNTTGWMHNRARMIAASFLTKDLLIDWRLGERYFMQRLLDGDSALNNGNWQWVAGTGVDAAPYFRIFNPFTQGEKYDPQGTYIRRWIPELRDVPVRFIHHLHLMPKARFEKLGYPAPIVDHAIQRDLALKMYRAV